MPDQFWLAVRRKPIIMAVAKPKIISWACHHCGLMSAVHEPGASIHDSQRIMATTENIPAPKKPALKARRQRGTMSCCATGSSIFTFGFLLRSRFVGLLLGVGQVKRGQ